MMALHMSHNQNGNNDAVFKPTIMLQDTGSTDPNDPRNFEMISVAGKKVRVDRIGYQRQGSDGWRSNCQDKARDLMYIVDP